MTKKVKNILFKLDIQGNGVVNYDSNDQKYLWNKNTEKAGVEFVKYDNVSFAKKRWYKNGDAVEKKIIISSNCLRHYIFKNELEVYSPETAIDDHLLISMIASPALISRGYMSLTKGETSVKRSTSLNITDAEQTNGAISTLDTFSRSGAKTQDESKSDNTFFKKETVGNIEYTTKGNIDLMNLQFISCDEVFDRMAFDPDFFEEYSQILRGYLPDFSSSLKYYKSNTSVIDIPEYGILLSPQNIQFLVKDLLKRMLRFSIRKASAYAETTSLKIKLVYDVVEDKINNNEGWTEVTEDVINNLEFDPEIFYTERDENESLLLRKSLSEKLKAKKLKNKEEAKANDKKKNKKDKNSDEIISDNTEE